MRHFSYYLFENFDPDQEVQNPHNPRSFLNESMDSLLGYIAQFPAGECKAADCEARFHEEKIQMLINAGIIRLDSTEHLLFDSPVFLHEDAKMLKKEIDQSAKRLADKLEECMPFLQRLCGEIQNGFPTAVNLYHILCGMIFDGMFFDYLEKRGAVATSRKHASCNHSAKA